MLRLIIILAISFLPTLLGTAFVIWALGRFGYTPLEPLSNSIGNIAAPYIDPLLQMVRNLLSRLPGGGL